MNPAVQLDNVSVTLGQHPALREVSLVIPAKSFTAIIGPNGCGKTTLLQVMLGLRAPDRGQVRLLGTPPAQLAPGDLGYVPQVKTLDRSFPALAIELVVTGLTHTWPWRTSTDHRQRALAAMERTGTEHLARRAIGHLSGGELQRVYLARSLVREPRLIVLDEPAAGMDLAAEADMYHHLLQYQSNHDATVVMVTHDWEGAREHASHVLLLRQRVVAFGPPAEVATNERLLALLGHIGHVHRTHDEAGDA